MLLTLRLILVPIFIALVTLAARRWGPRAAAFVTALPAVAGPTLVFYAVQQGRAFAAQAASSTMLCFMLAMMLPAYGATVTFIAALATQIAAQGLMLHTVQR